MTDEERRAEIEKAARGMCDADTGSDWDDLEASDQENYRYDAEAALKAVDYFTLRARLDAMVEAGEALLLARSRGGSKIVGRDTDGHPLNAEGVAARDLRAALTAAKGE